MGAIIGSTMIARMSYKRSNFAMRFNYNPAAVFFGARLEKNSLCLSALDFGMFSIVLASDSG